MKNIPIDWHNHYVAFLKQDKLSDKEIPFYLKRLRFYLDFSSWLFHLEHGSRLDKVRQQLLVTKCMLDITICSGTFDFFCLRCTGASGLNSQAELWYQKTTLHERTLNEPTLHESRHRLTAKSHS